MSSSDLIRGTIIFGAVLTGAAAIAADTSKCALFGAGDNRSVSAWETKRRPAILRTLEENEYGMRPVERPEGLSFSEERPPEMCLGGTAIRKRIRATYRGPGGTGEMRFSVWIPKASRPVPVFVHSSPRPAETADDPNGPRPVYLLPVERIVRRGYAVVAYCNADIAPDDRDTALTSGVFRVIGPAAAARTDTDWGVLSAWAWGMSRVMDWVETEPLLDKTRCAAVGLSRNGKTALVAGALDKRFAMTVSCCSGCGGARLNAADLPGCETIAVITSRFTHWFCSRFSTFAGHDADMPFDQHWLLSLVAPRLLYVSSATDDAWACPRGEYEGALSASPVWEMYGCRGLVSNAFPAPDVSLHEGRIGYHLRTGSHSIQPSDWDRYMDFADRHGWRVAGSGNAAVQADEIERENAHTAGRTIIVGKDVRFALDRKDALYRCGEEAAFTVTVFATNDIPATSGSVSWRLDNYGAHLFADGKVDLAKENPFVVRGTMATPGFLRLVVSGRKGRRLGAYSAAYEPENIRVAEPKPADFDSFWDQAVARLEREVPLDPRIEPVPGYGRNGVTVSRVSFATLNGERVYGILCMPSDLSKGPFPVDVHCPGAGPGFVLKHFRNGSPKRISLSMSVHSFPIQETDEETKALYEAQEASWRKIHGKNSARAYPVGGLTVSREKGHYFAKILGINRAFDWVARLPQADFRHVSYSGASQGGGMGLILAGLNRSITHGYMGVPAMCDLLSCKADGRQSGWPRITEYETQPDVDRLKTIQANARYFDAAYFAERIRIPVRLSVGYADESCAPHSVLAAYNAIPSSDKWLYHGIGGLHGSRNAPAKEIEEWLAANHACPQTVLAHRGHVDVSTKVAQPPENTLASLDDALAAGLGFECDVLYTKDRRVFTMHNGCFKRVYGIDNENSASMTWDYVSHLVPIDRSGRRHPETRAALFEEVCERARDGRICFVELKTGGEIVPLIRDILHKQHTANPRNLAFISFRPDAIRAVKRELPEYKAHLLLNSRHAWPSQKNLPDHSPYTAEQCLKALADCGADGLDFRFDESIPEQGADFVSKIRSAGYEFHVWTVDSLKAARKAFANGVQTVTSNRGRVILEGKWNR